MIPDSYEKFVKNAIAFRKSVWGAKEVVVKPMPDGRELLYFDGTYVFDLKELYKKYCHMVEQCNKTIELWKRRIENEREGDEPTKPSLTEVVYCKDCRDYLTPYCSCVERSQEDWYCADGIKRSEG